MPEEQAKPTVTIDMAVDTVGPRKFSAGTCVLIFGRTPIDACMATYEHEDEPDHVDRWVSTREDVIAWLQQRGLPGDRATALVDHAGDHPHEQVEVRKEVTEC